MDIKNEINLLKNELQENRKAFFSIQNKIENLECNCKHKDLKLTNYDTAICEICGKHFSWYCPTSPTLECDYEQDDGSYDEDSCRYCGGPEERK